MFGINGNGDGNSGPVIAPDPGAVAADASAPDPALAQPSDTPSAPPMTPSAPPADSAFIDPATQFSLPEGATTDVSTADAPADGTPPPHPAAHADPADNFAVPPITDMPHPDPADNGGPGAPSDNELFKLKQEALQSLSPLVDKLDQTPEEKFKTTMMMLQASDNPTLVRNAYESANQIGDEKVRAQALLDVVNEINYFTQKRKEEDEEAKNA